MLLLMMLETSCASSRFSPKDKDELKAAIVGCTLTCVHINGSDIRDWDVSRLTEMDQLFQSNSEFNANISAWNTSSVTSFA